MSQLIKTSISDFKLIFRDPSLRIFLVIPFLALALVNLVLPDLVTEFQGVDEYVPYVLMASYHQKMSSRPQTSCVAWASDLCRYRPCSGQAL